MTNLSLTPDPNASADTSASTDDTTVVVASTKYSRAWWLDTADRVVSTGAQAAIGLGIVSTVVGVDWVADASVVGIAMATSVLKALAISRTPVS